MFKLCRCVGVAKTEKSKKKKDICLNNMMENEKKLFKNKSNISNKIIGADKNIDISSESSINDYNNNENNSNNDSKNVEKKFKRKKFDNLFLNIPEHNFRLKRKYYSINDSYSPRIEHYEIVIYK